LKTTNEEIEKNVENDPAVRSGRTLVAETCDCYLRAAIRPFRLLKAKPRLPDAQATIKGNQETPFRQDSRNERRRSEDKKRTKKEGDEPDPRHWWKTAVAASFPT
jgi:hypothetical protein